MPPTRDSQKTLKVSGAASSHLPDIFKFAETDRHGDARSCPRAAAACKPVIFTSVLNIPVPDETTSTNGTLFCCADTVKNPREGWLMRLVCALCRSQKALPTIPVGSRQILFGYPQRISPLPLHVAVFIVSRSFAVTSKSLILEGGK